MALIRRSALALTLVVAACGGDGIDADSGDGSGTLLVRADIDNDGSGAEIEVQVERAGQAVNDAVVVITAGDAETELTAEGDGQYGGALAGWAHSYRIEVSAGEDWLSGSLDAPDLPHLVSPSPTKAFDPHLAEEGVVVVAWDGDLAMRARVETGDFDWEGVDEGSVEVPATAFENEDQTVKLRRQNRIDLAGGTPDSSLSVSSETEVTLIVVNPYGG